MASDLLDTARDVRPGEELDRARLEPYLREVTGQDGPIEIQQFPGGHSNLTYLLRIGDAEYVLRRPPFGSKVKSAHDMGREYRVLSHLAPVTSRAPRPVAYCEDESLIGAKFYVMERVRGLILRKEPPRGVVLDEATCRRLCESFVDALVELHTLDYEAAGLGDFGKPEGYIERQVTGWTRRYYGSQTDDIPQVKTVHEWLEGNMPPEGAPGVIHNDYKFDNLVLDPEDVTSIRAILDWEMSTVGDPLMDLGTALCYWVQADDPQPMVMTRFGPTTLPGMMTRAELAERYFQAAGRDPVDMTFYYTYGLFKTAVVVQQIYYRYKKGLTRDPRFAPLIHAVGLLCDHALGVIDRRTL